jgi:formylglycine-generating enzyme required for sulfatase activity
MKTIPPAGFPYKWCSNSGEDEFGIWLEISVRGIIQRMRWMNPGRFLMGSPHDEIHRHHSESQHEVTLSKGFWIADTTCSQELWLAVMETNPSKDSDVHKPVEKISWIDCDLFLQKMKVISEIAFSFPTEAQWEYACRAGTTEPFSFGMNITPEQVNYDANYPYLGEIKGINRGKTVRIKSLSPNKWGLYEMHGNVWEWCNDWYGKYEHTSVVDPTGPTEGKYRVLRGGSAFSGAPDCRSAARSQCHFDGCYDRNGFRFVWNPWQFEKKEMKLEEDELDDDNDKEIKVRKKKEKVNIPKKKESVANAKTIQTNATKKLKKKKR